jgi:hypothetical protein
MLKLARRCFVGFAPNHSRTRARTTNYRRAVSFQPDEMIQRFKERAAAVRKRPLPPVAGEERQHFIAQANTDFQDFAMIGDAEASLDDGVLTLRIDLRPGDKRS